MLNRLMLGMRVEVRSNEDRYRSAWLEGVIMAVYMPPGRGRHYKIGYDPDNFELLTDNGQPLTEEDVPDTQVRPIPPSFSEKNSYSVGDVVEFYDKGCWSLGTVIRVLHAAKYFLIHYPHTGLYNEFYLSQLRDAKLWSKGRWSLLYSQQSGDVIYDGNCPMAESSVQTSVASTPGDMQTDVQSQQQPEHEVDKQRRQRGLIGTRVTLKAEECLHFQNAKEVIKDSRTSKFSNHENGLNNVEAMSRRSNLHVPHLKGVKRTYDKRDGTFSGIQNGKCNKVKWFKHGDTAEVIEQRIKTHERELQVYRSVLKAFYAQNPSFLSSEKHRLLTNLRIELHITSEENTRELRKVRYCLYHICHPWFEDVGCVDGKSLFGAPSDFRYGPGKKPFSVGSRFMKAPVELVEKAYMLNGNKQIIIVSHSLGGLWVLYFLNQQPLSWRQKYIKHFIPMATRWGGTLQSMR